MRFLLIAAALAAPAHAAGTLRFGLDFDVDTLDPARSGSTIERVVNAAMCDQLLDVDEKMNVVPELATKWEWSPDRLSLTLHLRPGVVFQDGAKLDAEAVRANLIRSRTAPFSRRSELTPIVGVDALDPLTVQIRLDRPYAPLLSLLANRAGTMLSPRILSGTPEQVEAHPVCAGPFSFVERAPQDHITLQRFPGYWNAAAVSLDRIEFRIITDPGARRVNLQQGQLDVVNRLAAADVPVVQANPALRVAQSPSLGFGMLAFNLRHGEASNTPFAADVRIRRAFAKSLDFEALDKQVFQGLSVPSNQFEAPGTRYWDPAFPLPARDLDGARALLAAAAEPHPSLRLSVSDNPGDGLLGQSIQKMAGEAGFDVALVRGEPAQLAKAAVQGDFQAFAVVWSGRPDPDGNFSPWLRCRGALNWTGWCNAEADIHLDQAAARLDPAARALAYHQVNELWMDDLPYLPLYHSVWLWGLSEKVTGFVPRSDGVVRPIGLGLKP